ncbi:Spy/CpxP family protein refolding chaperone [Pseudochelatococcus sp. G4_1912]|uniref:Spy/CpxP family protein refolding chaperone n=1 Tax=Pseudochelatococcus sp. G4_1912 TaxID=3114288 RepID=UPI0039C69B10
MKKIIIAASAAMLFVGVTPAISQMKTHDKASEESADAEQRSTSRFSAEDRAAFTAARIAAIKAGLELKPDQEQHWAALETAVRAMADERAEQWAERREKRGERTRPDALEMLSNMAENMRTRSDRLTKFVEAAKPLFDSLDDAQKRRFAILLRESLGIGDRPGMPWMHNRFNMP